MNASPRTNIEALKRTAAAHRPNVQYRHARWMPQAHTDDCDARASSASLIGIDKITRPGRFDVNAKLSYGGCKIRGARPPAGVHTQPPVPHRPLTDAAVNVTAPRWHPYGLQLGRDDP